MKHLLFLCFLSALCFSCNQKPVTKSPYFFDFDEVVYYKTEATTEVLYKRPHTPSENLFIHIVNGNTPDKLSDTTFLSYIDTVGYTKKTIPVEKHAALKEIFKERKCDGDTTTSCTRFYRDIFVLKKKGKMTGVVKICYSCGDVELIGSEANTGCFGNRHDFKKLTEIVK